MPGSLGKKRKSVCLFSSLCFWFAVYQILFILKDGNLWRSFVVFIQLSLTNRSPCWSPDCFQNISLRYSRCVGVASRFMAAAVFTRTSWFQSSGLYRNMLTFVKILSYDGSSFFFFFFSHQDNVPSKICRPLLDMLKVFSFCFILHSAFLRVKSLRQGLRCLN